MEDQADILQHRIQVATVDREVRQRAGKRIRRQGDKQQETEVNHSHHCQHARDGIHRHAAAEQRDGKRPGAEQQQPQQQRAFMRAPGRGDAVVNRQQGIGVGRHIGHAEIIDDKGMNQYRKGAEDAGEKREAQRARQPH